MVVRRPPPPHALRRALPDLPQARLGRDGERLPRRRPGARASGRDQDPGRPARERRPVRGALPAGGPERSGALASEHRLDLRPRRGRGYVLHRDGVRRGADAEGADRRARPLTDRDRDRLLAPDPLGTALRAPKRDRPSRHQAAQRDRRQRRPSQGDGLRDRAGRHEPDDGGGLDHRDGAVPLARAGSRGARRPDLRPLLDGDRALRAPHRRGSVQRRHPGRDRDEASLADAGHAVDPPAGDSARPRLRDPPRTREGSVRALPLGRGDELRSGADRPRNRRLGRDGRGRDHRALARRRRRRDDDPPCPDDDRVRPRSLLRVRRDAAAALALAVAPGGARTRSGRYRRLFRLPAAPGAVQRGGAGDGAGRRGDHRVAGGRPDRGGGAAGERPPRGALGHADRDRRRAGSGAAEPDREGKLRHDRRLDREAEGAGARGRRATSRRRRRGPARCGPDAAGGGDQLREAGQHRHSAGAEGGHGARRGVDSADQRLDRAEAGRRSERDRGRLRVGRLAAAGDRLRGRPDKRRVGRARRDRGRPGSRRRHLARQGLDDHAPGLRRADDISDPGRHEPARGSGAEPARRLWLPGPRRSAGHRGSALGRERDLPGSARWPRGEARHDRDDLRRPPARAPTADGHRSGGYGPTDTVPIDPAPIDP